MKKSLIVAIVLLIAGIFISYLSYGEMSLVLKGDTLNINTASQSDFGTKQLVEGDITFAYGPFATYEEETKRYGITTSKKETNYYIVGNFSKEMLDGDDEFDDFYIILSTSDKDMISKLDDACDKWIEYFTSETTKQPDINIRIEGKLWTEPTDKDYVKYRNEAFDDLTSIGVKNTMYAELKINEGAVGKSSIGVFVMGIIMALVGAFIIIKAAIDHKKAKEDELY